MILITLDIIINIHLVTIIFAIINFNLILPIIPNNFKNNFQLLLNLILSLIIPYILNNDVNTFFYYITY